MSVRLTKVIVSCELRAQSLLGRSEESLAGKCRAGGPEAAKISTKQR